ncbi:MAG: carboxypeptidase regulatory-like domain-containing protein, partial [Candidatus Diapherotrites archaeon]|nr:carboxypeptidase regulatory-like domain-containing protein [Candidatus Diapherotrites archaeon]
MSLQDKYYALMDWLDSKGVPVYAIIDPLEDRGIPTFPLFIIFLIIVFGLIGFFAYNLLIPGATIKVLFATPEGTPIATTFKYRIDSGEFIESYADIEGKELSVKGNQITINVPESEGYKSVTRTEKIEDGKTYRIILQPKERIVTKVINVVGRGGELYEGSFDVQVNCIEGSDYETRATVVNGTLSVDLPNTCKRIAINPLNVNLEPSNSGILNIEEGETTLYLESAAETGKIHVQVIDSLGNPLSGISVRIFTINDVQLQSKTTDAAGSAEFDVEADSYYVRAFDESGNYTQATESEVRSVAPGQIVSFTIVMEKSTTIKLSVKVVSSADQSPIERAEIDIRTKEGELASSSYTNSSGIAEFDLPANQSFTIIATKSGYVSATAEITTEEDKTVEIMLQQAGRGNSGGVIIQVVDTLGNAVQNAVVELLTWDGKPIRQASTGSNGSVEFSEIAEGSYSARISKPGYGETSIDSITVIAGQVTEARAELEIGYGNLALIVRDEANEPIAGARVKKLYWPSLAEVKSYETDAEGKVLVPIRIDETVIISVEKEGYANYFSAKINIAKDETLEKTINLKKSPISLGIEFVGLYSNNETIPANSQISGGATYTARFIVSIPKQYDTVGVHIRTGKANIGRVNSVDEDTISIAKIYSAAKSVVKGTTYTPNLGEATDYSNLTGSIAKWSNIQFSKPKPGVYEIEAVLTTSQSATGLADIWYRIYGISGSSYERIPKDSVLGNAATSNQKQGLYANAFRVTYQIGASLLCDSILCKTFIIEDIRTAQQTAVTDEFPAKPNQRYLLKFDISSVSQLSFNDVTLSFNSESKGLKLGQYYIETPTGAILEGNAQSYELSVNIGSLLRNTSVRGRIEFLTEKEGSNLLTIKMRSSSGETILSKKINIKVAKAKELSLQMLPAQIVPFIDNQIILKVTDKESGNAVEGASINIYSNDEFIASGTTDAEGTFTFKLEAPAVGDVIKFEIQKEYYKVLIKEMRVEEGVVQLSPPKLAIRLNTAEIIGREETILFSNKTPIPMKLKDIKLNIPKEEAELVDIKWTTPPEELEIAVNADNNLTARITLTRKGMLIEKLMQIKGTINFYFENADFGKVWVSTLPIEIVIGLGNETDSLDCLKVKPVEWKINSINEEMLNLEIRNECTSNDKPIKLKNLRVRVDWGNKKEIGEFTIGSFSAAIEEQTITNEERIILPIVDEGKAILFELKFKPNSDITAAHEQPKIIFAASNYTQGGEQKLEATLRTEITLNNLAKCIEIKARSPIELTVMPYNLGFGIYAGYGYNPYYYGIGYTPLAAPIYGKAEESKAIYLQSQPSIDPRYGTPVGTLPTTAAGEPYSSYVPPYSYGYGRYLPGYSGAAYPYAGFAGFGFTAHYAGNYLNMWGNAAQEPIEITNRCATNIDFEVDTTAGINVSESKFTLGVNESKVISVSAGYRFGLNKVSIKAKESAAEHFTKLKDIDVYVMPFSGGRCIKIIPSRVIKLSDVFGRPTQLKVVNYCYAIGVRLPHDSSAVSITCQAPEIPTRQIPPQIEGQPQTQPSATQETTTGAKTAPQKVEKIELQGIASPYTYAYGGYLPNTWQTQTTPQGVATTECKLIQAIWFVGEEITPTPTGGVMQTIILEIVPNVSYRAHAALMLRGTKFTQLGALRMFAQESFFVIETRGTLTVRFEYPPMTSEPQQVILQDWWRGLQQAEAFVEPGNPNITNFMDCINKEALNLVSYWKTRGSTYGFVPQTAWKDNIYSFKPHPIGVMLIGQNYCGTTDRLSEVMPESYEDKTSGVVVSFALTDNAHNIQITIDRSKMKTACAKLEIAVTAKLTRVVYNTGTQDVGLTAKVFVLHPSIRPEQVDSSFVEECATTPAYAKEERELLDKCIEEGWSKDKFMAEAEDKGITRERAEELWQECARAQAAMVTEEKFECKEGTTGKTAYEKFGFNRLLFSWNPEEIQKNACDASVDGFISEDSSGYFCDAMQFAVAINKKYAELAEFINKYRNSITIDEKTKTALCEGKDSEECLSNIKDTKH